MNKFFQFFNRFGQIGKRWSEGDFFDCNGRVNFLDFVTLANNFSTSAVGTAAVPEPSGMLLAIVCFGALLAIKRRHH